MKKTLLIKSQRKDKAFKFIWVYKIDRNGF